MPSSRRVLRGAAQRPADGVLRAGADRPRCARAWCRGARRCASTAATGTRELLEVQPARRLRTDGWPLPLRLGMRIVTGLRERCRGDPASARERGRFASIEDVWRRSGVKAAALERLARADAFQPLRARPAAGAVGDQGAWANGRCRCSRLRRERREPSPATLTPLTAGREVVEDYRATQLSLRAHPVAFLRDRLAARGIVPCGDARQA